jgi:hypothetical protein
LSLVTRSEADKHDLSIKYSYINSSLTTYRLLDDRHDQMKEKGTDIKFWGNGFLQIRPHKASKVYPLIIRFPTALLELVFNNSKNYRTLGKNVWEEQLVLTYTYLSR